MGPKTGDASSSSRRQVYPNIDDNTKTHHKKASFESDDNDDDDDDNDDLSCCGPSTENFIMGLFVTVMIVFTIVIIFGDRFFLPSDRLEWCQAASLGLEESWKTYANRDAIRDPCYYERTPYLLGWSIFECDFGRRMLTSVVLGAAIGWERRAADRPAGIRTMSLVCLGAATFTMGGQFAFRSSTMGWDAARVSAAIPSGVGFLGSALIWKETVGQGQDQRNHVHGITTAASIWLSAAVGIGIGGALYVMSIYTVLLVAFVLRLGPLLMFSERHDEDDDEADTEAISEYDDDDDDDDEDEEDEEEEKEVLGGASPLLTAQQQQERKQQKMERHKSLPAIGMMRGIPKQVSMKKRMQLIKLESIKIQKKQHPTLKSD